MNLTRCKMFPFTPLPPRQKLSRQRKDKRKKKKGKKTHTTRTVVPKRVTSPNRHICPRFTQHPPCQTPRSFVSWGADSSTRPEYSLKWTIRCPMAVSLPGRDLAWSSLGNDISISTWRRLLLFSRLSAGCKRGLAARGRGRQPANHILGPLRVRSVASWRPPFSPSCRSRSAAWRCCFWKSRCKSGFGGAGHEQAHLQVIVPGLFPAG